MDRDSFLIKISLLFALILFPYCLGVSATSQAGNLSTPEFDANRAFGELEKQCRFGTREPGSTGHRRCRDYLVSTLENYSPTVQLQPFIFQSSDGPIEMSNIIASFNLMNSRRIILCAHWDTRPRADRETDPVKMKKPIPGANDGASGVAVLLEVARIISENPPPIGVLIILFDGEDWGEEGNLDDYLLGSKYYTSNLDHLPADYAVLLDMIGDKDLTIYKEQYSNYFDSLLVDTLWSRAAELSLKAFIPEIKYSVYDDHIPLNQAGIPSVDIIDFDYPYWHTLEDTPDKCSPNSLKQVGDLLISIIYNPIKNF